VEPLVCENELINFAIIPDQYSLDGFGSFFTVIVERIFEISTMETVLGSGRMARGSRSHWDMMADWPRAHARRVGWKNILIDLGGDKGGKKYSSSSLINSTIFHSLFSGNCRTG